ncbi:MAG: hypothetical protein IRY99_14220 [Isosphaeraceae bacterium]|nr:hypothetical protein [Isosphaeraceae bacterium]
MKISTARVGGCMAVLALLLLSGRPVQGELLIGPSPTDVIVTTNADDASFGPFPIPGGPFPFFGMSESTFFVNSNGNLTFGTGNPLFFDSPFPITGSNFMMVAPFWDDLFLPPGEIRLNNGVELPNTVVVIWNGVGVFPGTSPTRITAEAILVGAGSLFLAPAGTIIFSYGDITGTEDNSVTVGLNRGSGGGFANLPGLPSSLNTAQAIGLSNRVFTFTPTATGGYTVSEGAPAIIPEPATGAMGGIAAVWFGLGYVWRRRRRAAA